MASQLAKAKRKSASTKFSLRVERTSRIAKQNQSARTSVMLSCILLVVIVVVSASIRLRLQNMPLERDEGEYAYAGQLILQGFPPYAFAYNMKLPGTYLAYAAIMAAFGQTPTGVHLGLLLVNALTIGMLFFLAKRVLDATAGIVTAASYTMLSTSPSVLGFAGHATHFVVLVAIGGILLLSNPAEVLKPWRLCGAGALLGFAFLMKQPGIFFLLFGGVWLVFQAKRSKLGWRKLTARFSLFFTAATVPFALICLWMWKVGLFSRFWFWTFTYAHAYGTAIRLQEAAAVFGTQFSGVVRPAVPIWLLAAFGLFGVLSKYRHSDTGFFVLTFLICSFLAVCPGFYFRQHYFIVLLPAVSLLAGAAVSIFVKEFAERATLHGVRFLPVLLFVGSFGYAVWTQWDFLFELDPISACRAEYGFNPFPEAVEIAHYLKTHSSPSSRVVVLGSEPEIYFYANRRSATGYIYTYPLMELQPYAAKMQQEMISEIERKRPEFMVLVNVPLSWLSQPGSSQLLFDWAQRYIPEHYQLEGRVDILENSQFHWGNDAVDSEPSSPYTVRIFKRTPDSHGSS